MKEEEVEEEIGKLVGEDVLMEKEIQCFKMTMNLVKENMTVVHPIHIKEGPEVISTMRAGGDTEIEVDLEVEEVSEVVKQTSQMIELILCLEKEEDQEVVLVEMVGAKKEGGVVL